MSRPSIAKTQRDWLRSEMTGWQSHGLITPEQAHGILGYYESPDEDSQRKRSLAVFVLVGMAAFLFGLAVLLVIGFNWEEVPRAGKVALILFAVAGTHALGFHLRFKKGQLRLSEVVFFLACLFYGSGIWLIAQAFHLNAHYPDGVWWWALGVLPFALFLESTLLHLLLVVLLAIWSGMEVFGFAHLHPWWLLSGVPNGAYSLPLLALPGLLWANRRASVGGVGLYVPLIAWWIVLQSFAWGAGERSAFLIGTMGALLLVVAEAHRPGNAMAIPYRLWGTALSAGSLIALSSDSFWSSMLSPRGAAFRQDFSLVGAMAFEVVLLGTLLAGGAVLLVLRRERFRADALARAGFPVALAAGLCGSALWSMMDFATEWPFRLFPVVLANLAMLGLALYLVRIGIREERVRPFAFGILYFLTWAFVRYLDLFREAGGMLGAAALFTLCAAGLIVVARFWGRTREMKSADEPPMTPVAEYAGPGWLSRVADWTAPHRRAILLAAAAGHLAVLGGMIVVESAPIVGGTRVILHVQPVDPRDLFRGDYVVLSYDFGRRPGHFAPGATVYLRLEPEADGRHWRAAGYSATPPETGVYLRGRYSERSGMPEFGIESYFVQEGKGLEWERLRNARRLSAEVAVSGSGKAKLVRLIAEE